MDLDEMGNLIQVACEEKLSDFYIFFTYINKYGWRRRRFDTKNKFLPWRNIPSSRRRRKSLRHVSGFLVFNFYTLYCLELTSFLCNFLLIHQLLSGLCEKGRNVTEWQHNRKCASSMLDVRSLCTIHSSCHISYDVITICFENQLKSRNCDEISSYN